MNATQAFLLQQQQAKRNKILRPSLSQVKQLAEDPYADLTVGNDFGLYSPIPPLFELCGDNDLISLSLSGINPFLDWLGWQGTDVYRLVRNFILYNRAEQSRCEPTAGWLANPCADPNGIETNYDNLVIEGFSRLRRAGPTRDTTKVALNYCEVSPRFRLDGNPITDDVEYDIIRAAEVLVQDLVTNTIFGDASTAGQSDGLEQVIVDTNPDTMLNSIIVDWNGNDLDGGAGITWNGTGVSATIDFVDLLKALVRRIRDRIRMVPNIRANSLSLGDIVLALPGSFATCILDAYTCWSVCAGDYNLMQTFEARRFRDSLEGGAYGAGAIMIEGITIPILPVDQLLHDDGTFDAYLLTKGVGPWRWFYGQYNNMNPVAALTSSKTGLNYAALDGGRVLQWAKSQNTCLEEIVEMQTRLVCEAPWAQVRIQDISCSLVGGPISADPNSPYFPYYYDCQQQAV